MEGASEDDFPCSSLTADSFIRIGLEMVSQLLSLNILLPRKHRHLSGHVGHGYARTCAGSAWGLFLGPYEAKKKGLTGHGRASFVVKSVGKYGLQCGLFAGVFTATRCGVRRYRMEKDWVNACIAGAVTGAAVAVRTRNWMQIVGTATIVSAIATAADYSTAD